MAKPHAVPKELVCSECGEDWDKHPENPRRRDCIELLLGKPPVTYTYPYQPTYYNSPMIDPNPWWHTNSGDTTTATVWSTLDVLAAETVSCA
jgi:hypothetical protein